MADIKQVRLKDTDYDIHDERIVSGFLDLDESVEIKGKMVVIMGGALPPNHCAVYINDVLLTADDGGMIVTYSDNTCTITADDPDGVDYIAIVKEE